MPIGAKRATLSEKGLMTPDNCVFALVDLQPQKLSHVANVDPAALIEANTILAKTACAFKVPLVLSTLETQLISSPMWSQVSAVLAAKAPVPRTTISPWDDPNFVAAIERTGRRRIVLSGLWTETSIAFAGVQALYDGYEVFVVEDGCGALSQFAHANAMQRVIQAGAKAVTALSALLELQRDWAAEATYAAVMEILRMHGGRYGSGFDASGERPALATDDSAEASRGDPARFMRPCPRSGL